MEIADELLSPSSREILGNLAEALFPLDAWIKEPKQFVPADKDLPWRKDSGALKPQDLGIPEFLAGLVRETAGDVELLVRWESHEANPLRLNPLPDPHSWRAQRGLAAEPEFGIVHSENVLLGADERPIALAEFYAGYWPLVKKTVEVRRPNDDPAVWKALAVELLEDRCPEWPTPLRRSSVFLRQLGRDLLYAMMGMRTQVPAPWRFALLIELGEHRRVGNQYGPEEAQQAVDAFEQRVREITSH